MNAFIQALKNFVADFRSYVQKQPVIVPDEVLPPPAPPAPPVPVQPDPVYLWDTPFDARHSVRLICDEEGLSVDDKNLLCQVIDCESGFNIKAVRHNTDARHSTDYGICQFNDYWYRDLISPEDASNNPEKAVRLMIKEFQAGHLKDWVCYSTGMYKTYKS